MSPVANFIFSWIMTIITFIALLALVIWIVK